MRRTSLGFAFYFTSIILVSSSFSGIAHPGRTDSNGGHNDRKHGGYHYHGGPYVTRPAKTVVVPSRPLVQNTPAFQVATPIAIADPGAETGYLINGKTYVPLRFVAEKLGAKVSWDAQNRMAIIEHQSSPTPIMVKVTKR